jgi:hypothetical protein
VEEAAVAPLPTQTIVAAVVVEQVAIVVQS